MFDPREKRMKFRSLWLFSMLTILFPAAILAYFFFTGKPISARFMILLGIIVLISLPVFLFCTVKYLNSSDNL